MRIADLRDAAERLVPGGEVALEDLPVVASFFGQDKIFLQQPLQRDLLFSGERVRSGAEKGDVNRILARRDQVRAQNFIVKQKNQVKQPAVQVIKCMVCGYDLELHLYFRMSGEKILEHICVLGCAYCFHNTDF